LQLIQVEKEIEMLKINYGGPKPDTEEKQN
jgi:hypothetical protein